MFTMVTPGVAGAGEAFDVKWPGRPGMAFFFPPPPQVFPGSSCAPRVLRGLRLRTSGAFHWLGPDLPLLRHGGLRALQAGKDWKDGRC